MRLSPRTVLEHLLAFGAGMLAFSLAWDGISLEEVPPAQSLEAPRRTHSPQHEAAPQAPPPPADTALKQEIELQAEEIDSLVDDLEELTGTPLSWSPGWPEPLSPAGFRSSVEDAFGTCQPPGELVDIDCGEPPCLAVLRQAGEERPGIEGFIEGCPRWRELFGEESNKLTRCRRLVSCPDGREERILFLGSSRAVEHLDPQTHDERANLKRRLEERCEELRSNWQCGG